MKKLTIALSLLVFSAAILSSFISKQSQVKETVFSKPRQGVAVILTGAAARIPQEAALLEELDKRGLLKDLVFISGVSSGALNSVILNGILNGRMTWDEYKSILFNLNNSDIFVQNGKLIPVSTAPARALYKKVVEEKLGYYQMGDLPYFTELSITHLEDLSLKKIVYRMCSRKINPETDLSLSVVDILMASSAFPLVFPSVRIQNAKTIPDVKYVDGGVGDDHLPYTALFEFEKNRGFGVEKVFIISRKGDSIPEISEELKNLGINDKGIFDKMGISLDAMLKKGLISSMEKYALEAPDLLPRTYVWIPGFKKNFLMFNFDQMRSQYEITLQWAETHDPIALSDYLLPYQTKDNDK